MGLAEKVMSLTFGRNINYMSINLHMFRDGFVVKKGFLTSAVHIPKQSLMIHFITVDTTSLDQRASKKATRDA